MPSPLPSKVTLGVTGGIAAYKAAELVRALQQHSLDVHVVMTRAAEEFVRPLTFAALTGHKVITSMWQADAYEGGSIEHISEAESTHLLLVAPATAHTLAKFAHGLADDFLSTLYLATAAPVMVAPAMNVNMWNHAATQANLTTLRQRGVEIIEPGSGYLACGMTGSGRLAEIDEIVHAVLARIQRLDENSPRDLAGETVMVTAGGTREPIDPVRFIGNRSSGRMGYALASAARSRGAKVILISAPTALDAPAGCERIDVTTASQMHAAVLAHLPQATIVIKAAAVSDFRPMAVAAQKLKRNGPLTLTLEPTEDIAQSVAAHRNPGTLLIVFAAETASDAQELIRNAREKLGRKGADAIVANDVSQPGLGFDSELNAATFITAAREVAFPAQTKSCLAHRILDEVTKIRAAALPRTS
jgi:phosphopantothenoylcysteine decarboxylase/phosphopantothenate--cysteine ligase